MSTPEINYLTQEIHGHVYGAWYRVAADGCIEVYWRARIASAHSCHDDQPERLVRELLTELVHEDERSYALEKSSRPAN
jgi:hypothetical protein